MDAVYDFQLIRLIENIHFVLFGQDSVSINLTDKSYPFRTVIINPVEYSYKEFCAILIDFSSPSGIFSMFCSVTWLGVEQRSK